MIKFTVGDVRSSASRMVDMMTAAYGSKLFALNALARKCQVSPRSLKRFINGQSKDRDIHVALNIRSAYRRLLVEKIEEMQAEIKALDEADESLNVWDIDLKIAALENKLKERVEGLRNG